MSLGTTPHRIKHGHEFLGPALSPYPLSLLCCPFRIHKETSLPASSLPICALHFSTCRASLKSFPVLPMLFLPWNALECLASPGRKHHSSLSSGVSRSFSLALTTCLSHYNYFFPVSHFHFSILLSLSREPLKRRSQLHCLSHRNGKLTPIG